MAKLKNSVGAKFEQHPFHLVDPSALPFVVSAVIGLMLSSLAFFFHGAPREAVLFAAKIAYLFGQPSWLLLWSVVFGLFALMLVWGTEVTLESTAQGHHTFKVQRGLRYGMMLFILSEVMFFFSFFWALFHLSAMATVAVGGIWPPKGIETLNPWHLPLANTIILLSSGVCTVWAHRAIIAGRKADALWGIAAACLYGLLFSWFQFLEYGLANFSINDGAYGSVFYMATGFHGVHVIVGTILLLIAYVRLVNNQYGRDHHLGFEFAAWYWHFVDVVWLFLYLFLYWWASQLY
jgi:heme/copper-type cytochrome/quinol oxidase subunit 3